ncbi:MAG: HIT domain-containing protein [Rickettsiaceae bacterium]
MYNNHYDSNNIFNKIINDELESKKFYEDDYLIAIHDINPVAPIHALVIPKGEYVDYDDFISNADQDEVYHYFKTIEAIAKNLDVENHGYRIVTNKGAQCGQTVFHFHTHIISGKKLGELG